MGQQMSPSSMGRNGGEISDEETRQNRTTPRAARKFCPGPKGPLQVAAAAAAASLPAQHRNQQQAKNVRKSARIKRAASGVAPKQQVQPEGTRRTKRKSPTTNNPASQPQEEDPPDETEDVDYEVEKICGIMTEVGCEPHYLVKWKGYDDSHRTWEPQANLNCEEKIDGFLEEFRKARKGTKRVRKRQEKKSN